VPFGLPAPLAQGAETRRIGIGVAVALAVHALILLCAAWSPNGRCSSCRRCATRFRSRSKHRPSLPGRRLASAQPSARAGSCSHATRCDGGIGDGSGAGGLFGNGPFVGDGPGALKARICFIPETTRSLREIPACSAIYEQFLDEIDIPPRDFAAGFPGFEDRTEYFAERGGQLSLSAQIG
jgi:hypothetical protein